MGDELLYHCVSGVLEDSKGGNGKGKLAVKCNTDGDFEINDQGQGLNYDIGDPTAPVPPCRATVACPNQAPLLPNGPETTPQFMLESTNTNVKEYDSAKYKCQAGAR